MIIENDNDLANAVIKMLNTNKNNSNNEIVRLGSYEARDIDYRRNGTLNLGGLQMTDFLFGGQYANFGGVLVSSIVGS
jgi:hypothetical protein